jgi:hypothetical protein
VWGGITRTSNVPLTPEADAVKVALVQVFTGLAVTTKVADVEPCGTITVEGTLTDAVLELESDTMTPPLPAGAVRVTVPVADWPLSIAQGLTQKFLRTGCCGFVAGLTVIPNVMLTPA